jgi:hypothetical protein
LMIWAETLVSSDRLQVLRGLRRTVEGRDRAGNDAVGRWRAWRWQCSPKSIMSVHTLQSLCTLSTGENSSRVTCCSYHRSLMHQALVSGPEA